ncbi:MAG: SDR family NAD(P)-dependent oxidoreductase [Gloeomargaritaceae cyanobacterium C42_A2020_066]|nr:SDR family NAD(P)-dependent oxidoreductase [Gloeomargaritaceae cyanobacterium C42_A2020_066]
MNVVVVGASRGIGAAVAAHCAGRGDSVWSVSRSPAVAGQWIKADVTTPAGRSRIMDCLGSSHLDALLYMGGTWEHGAFTAQYDFRKSGYEETLAVLSVNLIAPIELTRLLVPNLTLSINPRAIFIGALSGFDNQATPEVANTASKFGLRGAIQALRLALQSEGIGFTVVNPGNVATPEVLDDIKEGRFPEQTPIPMRDLLATIDWILTLSNSVDVGDLALLQRFG